MSKDVFNVPAGRSLLTGILLFLGMIAMAQDRSIEGTVTDKEGMPLIGANILIKGTSTGTSADLDGRFKLTISADAQALVVSYVGFETKEITLQPGVSSYSVMLSSQVELDEVVVTALGVERDEKALGYSVQKLGSQQIAAVKPTNIANSLAGKVSGVYITEGTSGPTASANVTIRGASSLSGSNQALFVVNGMPITNGLFSPGDGLNGSTTIDFGNAAQLVNPDDIESISVLKGPAAAALYGSRASNGVILITTKTGKSTDGWGVDINSTTNFESILRLPDYQNEYGFGGYGFYSYRTDGPGGVTYTEAADGTRYYDAFGENWGPRLDGTPVVQFNTDGQPAPYSASPDNIRNFFRTGITAINNISLSNADDQGDFRLSYTNQTRQGIVPNTDLSRNTLYTSMGRSLFDDKLNVRVNAMYVRSSSDNVPNAGYDENSSVMYGWLWYPRQVPTEDLKDYWAEQVFINPNTGAEETRPLVDQQQRYVENLWVNNPWFVVNENTNSFQSNRLIGNAVVDYSLTDQFSARLRFGADVLDDQRQYRRAPSTRGVPFGSYREDELSFSETNTELMLSFDADPSGSNPVQFGLRAGGNIMRQQSNQLIANNPQLSFPGLYTITNARAGVLTENAKARKGINSVFLLGSLSFDNFLYLDITGRNDWSSTLPDGNNSYFYPSVAASAVLSEVMNLPTTSALSFLKLRASYAEVGNDTDPYLLNNFFDAQPLFGSNPAFAVNTFAANPNLRPELTTALEFGVDARFLNGRLRVDATYYDMLTKDQITFLPVAISSGKQTNLVNAGEISNRGVEVLLSAEPVVSDKFSWSVTLNLGHNRAVVEKLPDGYKSRYPIIADVYPGDEGSDDIALIAREGELLGQLEGLGFQRDDQGNIIHSNGLPLLTEERVTAGSYQPDLRAGIYNTFRFGNISFGFLFDGQIGGNIYSRTHALMNTGGTITNNDDPNLPLSTLDGRAEYDISYGTDGKPVYTLVDEGGVVGPGVMFDADGNLVENTVAVPTRDYFYAYYGNGFNRDNIEAATYDATYVKLRELRLTWALPQSTLDKIGLRGASVSVIGRNLLLFTDVPSIDPETYSIRGGRFVPGFESTQLPSTRSYGVALNISL